MTPFRVGVFSDSHGDREALARLLEKMGHIDAACFLGDVASDANFLREKLAEMPHGPVLYAVRGNNDLASMLPDDMLIELGGKRIYMTHGHLVSSPLSAFLYRVKAAVSWPPVLSTATTPFWISRANTPTEEKDTNAQHSTAATAARTIFRARLPLPGLAFR